MSIEVSEKSVAKITGGEAACQLAREKIDEISSSVNEDVSVTDAM